MGVNDFIKIGDRIKQLRKEKGISQRDMAKSLGINVSTYSNYENNHREPSSEIIEKVSKILGVSVQDLLVPKDIYINIGRLSEAIIRGDKQCIDILTDEEKSEMDRISTLHGENAAAFYEKSVYRHKRDELVHFANNRIAEYQGKPISEFQKEVSKRESQEKELLELFARLNDCGKHEAIKRITEMLCIIEYTK